MSEHEQDAADKVVTDADAAKEVIGIEAGTARAAVGVDAGLARGIVTDDAATARGVVADETAAARGVVAKAAEEAESVTVEGLRATLRTIKWLLFIMFVVTAGSVWRSVIVQESADKATAAANDSKDAAGATLEAVNNAIAAFDEPSPPNPELVRVFEAVRNTECIVARIAGETPLPEGCARTP